MHNALNTPGRCSTASARPAPGKRAGRHARRSTGCAWHPSRNPARRSGLRSVPLLHAVSLHPLLAAGVKRNSVPWAPKLTRNVSRARAIIPLTFLQSIITSGSVWYLFGFDGCALWCRCREKISRRQMRQRGDGWPSPAHQPAIVGTIRCRGGGAFGCIRIAFLLLAPDRPAWAVAGSHGPCRPLVAQGIGRLV